ncbi:MAG TPA: hypothetical protein VGL94_00125 [Ktedonobacteraceae bacterium]|jgi:hypothetical protein
MVYILKMLGFVRSHLLLIILGMSCEVFYILYFVRQFSLLKYYSHLYQLTNSLTGTTHAAAAMFFIVFTILFAFFGLAWWEARHLTGRATLYLILGFGGLFALTMAFVYPITAIDIYNYIAENLVLVQYHANPITVPAATFSNDPLITLAGGWTYYPAPYGPLGLIIDALSTQIVGRNLFANLLFIKLMFASMLILEAFLIYKILSRLAPKLALAGALFIAWNPYTLMEFSANGHNDIAMMLFVLLAILALVYDHLVLAFALIVISALVKFATLPLLPLFLIYGIAHQPTMRKRIIYLALVIFSTLMLFMLVYAPFWQGIKTLNALQSQDQRYMSSFATMLADTSLGKVTRDQAKWLGRVLFGIIYIYALFLSRKRLPDMLRACFLTLFFFTALAVTNFEVWYAIWPMMFAILIPSTIVSLSMFVFAYGVSLSVIDYIFLASWLGFTEPSYALANNLAYLMTFMPAILMLFCFTLQQIVSVKPKIDKGRVQAESPADEPVNVKERASSS